MSPRVVSGRPRAAGCASPVPRRGIQGLIYEQEVYQASTHAPLSLYLLREEGRRRVRVEVPREEAVDKLGLLLFNELALFVVALGREQRPALAPRQRNLPRIATKLGV